MAGAKGSWRFQFHVKPTSDLEELASPSASTLDDEQSLKSVRKRWLRSGSRKARIVGRRSSADEGDRLLEGGASTARKLQRPPTCNERIHIRESRLASREA